MLTLFIGGFNGERACCFPRALCSLSAFVFFYFCNLICAVWYAGWMLVPPSGSLLTMKGFAAPLAPTYGRGLDASPLPVLSLLMVAASCFLFVLNPFES